MAGGVNPIANLAGKVNANNELMVAVSGAGSGGTSSVDKAGFSAGVSAGTPAMGVFETVPSTLANGEMGIVAVNANRELKVEVTAGGGSNASVGATGAAVPASATLVGVSNEDGDLTALAAVAADYNTTTPPVVPISMLGIALPGAGGPTAFTGAVTVATLPLPTGAATAARQDTGNTSLASIDGKTPALGQAVMASSVPVVIASNQTAVPISAASLPLPTGAATLAEQQTQTTALQIIDDWDESDRAKVNIIVGQAGVTAGAGNVAANTPRTTLAADDPAVAVLGATTGAKVITDANGTIQQYLRGLVYLGIQVTKSKFVLGTPQTVINLATDIAAGNFSGGPAATFDNTTDAAVPYALNAKAVAVFPDWAAAPVAGTVVELWGLLKDVDGTNDDTDAPTGTANGGARYFGAFIIAAADALQRRTISIDLLGCEKVDFYFKNLTAQNMNNDGGTNATLIVTPMATGFVL